MNNVEFSVHKEDYDIGKWSGGTTKQLAIYPEGASYGERKFLWRLSSAAVEVEESDFTPLPDYDRVLIVLEGEVVLVHKEMRVSRLAKYEQDRFGGEYETKSFGKITDFNLMVRKGNQGFAEVISLSNEYTPLNTEGFPEYGKISQGFYCAEGFCIVSFENESLMIKQGELLTASYAQGNPENFGIMGEGKVVRTQVYFNEEYRASEEIKTEKQSPQKEDIAKESKPKITFEDVKLSAIICWSNFRGSKFVFRGLKNLWYDDKLYRAIERLERTLLPYLICLLGFGIAGFTAWENVDSRYVAPVVIGWIIFDIVIINPLLYLRVIPRPVRRHIKSIDELTEEEKDIEARRRGENRKADNILKKYEITGRNKYIE